MKQSVNKCRYINFCHLCALFYIVIFKQMVRMRMPLQCTLADDLSKLTSCKVVLYLRISCRYMNAYGCLHHTIHYSQELSILKTGQIGKIIKRLHVNQPSAQ